MNRFWRIWAAVRQVMAVRGLLDWLGWWKPLAVSTISVLLTIWGHIKGLPGPLLVVVFLGTFTLILIAWRVISVMKLAEMHQQYIPPAPSPDLSVGTADSVGLADRREQINRWRAMVTQIQNESGSKKWEVVSEFSDTTKRDPAVMFVRHPDFPGLRPYLREATREMMNRPHVLRQIANVGPIDQLCNHVLDDIEQKAKEWGLD